jgi:hypothetical protein
MAQHEVILTLEGKLPLPTNSGFIVMGIKNFSFLRNSQVVLV